MTYYIFLESAGQNLVNERYCNIPSISNASFGHKRSGSPSPNSLSILNVYDHIAPSARLVGLYSTIRLRGYKYVRKYYPTTGLQVCKIVLKNTQLFTGHKIKKMESVLDKS